VLLTHILVHRFAESSGRGDATGGEGATFKVPGSEYKAHLNALWQLLLDAGGGGAPEANGDGAHGKIGVGESSRRALLRGLFTTEQLMDSAFS